MVGRQYLVVAICLLANLVDGFDVLAMSFTAPAVANDWHLAPDRLGALLSIGLAGMAFGALCLSFLADVVGRRPVTIFCFCLVTAGMFGAGLSQNYGQLMLARFATGFGIGAMISSTSSLVAEFASKRARGMAMGLMAVMFPAGAVVGGAVAVALVRGHGWQPVFMIGGTATLLLVPICVFFLPESVDHLLTHGHQRSLPRINRTLRALGAAPLAELPLPIPGATRVHPRHLFSPPHRAPLLQLAVVMFLTMLSFYFILSWAPKLLVQRGLSANAGIVSGMLLNIGGMIGGVSLGVILRFVSLRTSMIGVLVGMASGIALFGVLAGSGALLVPLALALGFTMYGSMVVMFTLMTSSFPSGARATAVGLCTTAGRVGSVLGPYFGGVLLAHGQSVTALCVILALPAVVGAVVMTASGTLGCGRWY